MSAGARQRRAADILGNGPAALTAAITLARRGWAVSVRGPTRSTKCTPRIDLLAGSAVATLERLGVSRDDLHAVASSCPGTWSNWEADGPAAFDYLATPGGPAWAVDRTAFEHLLKERAVEAGVAFQSAIESLRFDAATFEHSSEEERGWLILAAGRLASVPRSADWPDDRLIALVGLGRMSASAEPPDRRLIVEAVSDGWVYVLAGPGSILCCGVITDLPALAGKRPQNFAADAVGRTERVGLFLQRLDGPLGFTATPVPCRWLPLVADPKSIRIGDAHASYDPVAGRGLWEALRGAEEIALTLDREPERLGRLERRSRYAYIRYLVEREEMYRRGGDRFGSGFWMRRRTADPDRQRAIIASRVFTRNQSLGS